MNKPQQNPSRARLQELLAIPEKDRTEEQWDELNELEIMMAAANRETSPKQGDRRNDAQPQRHAKPNVPPHGQQPQRKFHKRRPKRKAP